MSLEIEQYGNNLVEEDSQSLSSIYRQISIEFNDCFDEVYEHNNILAYIDEYFPIEIKHIDNTKFINDVTFFKLVSISLIELNFINTLHLIIFLLFILIFYIFFLKDNKF
jgi:hypothetical protein